MAAFILNTPYQHAAFGHQTLFDKRTYRSQTQSDMNSERSMTSLTASKLTPEAQLRAARMFNIGSVSAIVLLPMLPVLLLWIAGSIVIYSANIFHPNPVVRRYTKYGGYRFYGFVGGLLASMSFSSELNQVVGGGINLLIVIWAIGIVVVVPFGILAIVQAGKENWEAMPIDAMQAPAMARNQDA